MARDTFKTHPKFRRLVFLLGIPEAHVLGLCEFLWGVGYDSGNPEIGEAIDIELAARWTGERGKFCLAALNCGGSAGTGLIEPVTSDNKRITFVDSDSTNGFRFQIHDLYDHAPDYVKRRMERESERVSRGITISDIRRKAVNSRKDRQLVQTNANEKRLNTREVTNVTTPAPAPAPPIKRNSLPSAANAAEGPPLAMTELPSAVNSLVKDFWNESWKQEHGTEFCWGTGKRGGASACGTALAAIMETLGCKRETPEKGSHPFSREERLARNAHNVSILPKIKSVIRAYMADKSQYFDGHPPMKLRAEIHKFIARAEGNSPAPSAPQRSQDRVAKLLEDRLVAKGVA